MLTKLEIQNINSDVLALPLADISGGYLVKEIDGLDPVTASIVSTSLAQVDGAQPQSSRRDIRNITMKLGLMPDYAASSVASLRKFLYNYLMPKANVEIKFYIDDTLFATTTGTVESFANSMFSADPEVDISIVCYDPDFYSPTAQVVSANTVAVVSPGTTVLFDSAAPTSLPSGAAGGSKTWTHTVAGTNTGLLVGVEVDSLSDGLIIPSVSFNGVPMNPITRVQANNLPHGFLEVFGLSGVATGAGVVSVTNGGSGTVDDVAGASLSFNNVDPANPFGPPVNARGAGTTASVAVTSTHIGNILAAFVANGDNINSATAPATSKIINNFKAALGDGVGNIAASISTSTGSTVTPAWSINSETWAVAAIEVLFGVSPNTVTLEYDGTSDAGLMFTMNVNRTITGFALYNTRPDGTTQVFTVTGSFAAGDVVVVNSIPGQKALTLTRAGLTTSVLYFLQTGSTWPSLGNGDNEFKCVVPGVSIPYNVSYMAKYGGL